jgi:hypothetical protein
MDRLRRACEHRAVIGGVPPALAALCGLIWVALGIVRSTDPRYWSPVTTLDYAAVGGFSAATIVLGACIWPFGRHADRAVRWISGFTAIAAVAVGLGNFLEDWLLIRPFGLLFMLGLFGTLLGLIALTVAVAVRGPARVAALVPLLCVPGLLLSMSSSQTSILGGTLMGLIWLGVAALAVRQRPAVVAT